MTRIKNTRNEIDIETEIKSTVDGFKSRLQITDKREPEDCRNHPEYNPETEIG